MTLFYRSLVIFLLVTSLSFSKAWAGDMMNLAFLEAQAEQKDETLAVLTRQMETVLQGSPPSKTRLGSDLTATCLFTSGYFIPSLLLSQCLGGTAALMLMTTTGMDWV